jgi:hypothetical protein
LVALKLIEYWIFRRSRRYGIYRTAGFGVDPLPVPSVKTVDQRGAMTELFVSQTSRLLMGTNLTFATVLDTTADASPTIESISFKCEGIAASTFQTTALAADVFSITALYSENSEFNPVTSFARTDTATMGQGSKGHCEHPQKTGAGAALRNAHSDGQCNPLSCVDFRRLRPVLPIQLHTA